jgi:uncharacterized RDD family membrane protein YckC
MTTAALTPRASQSLYSGMFIALIALAFALQASFLAGLAGGREAFAAGPPAVSARGSSPCAIP